MGDIEDQDGDRHQLRTTRSAVPMFLFITNPRFSVTVLRTTQTIPEGY